MSPPALDGDLEQQIRAWAQRSRHAELGATGVDPGLLYQAEVQSLLSRLQPAGYQA
jgi:hypothetical protein